MHHRFWSLALGLTLALPVLAAPELQGIESAAGQGIIFKAQEPLTYEVRPSEGKVFIFLLKDATLGQVKGVQPTNFGTLVLSQTPAGVNVRVTGNGDLTYQLQAQNDNKSLLLQAIPKGQTAQAIAPPPVAAQTKPAERITLKARNQEVRDTLSFLSRISRTSIVISPDVQAKVNVSLENVLFEDALKSVAAIANLQFRREGEVYVVSQKPPNPNGAPTASDDGIKELGDPRPKTKDEDPGDRIVSVIANDTELSRILKEMANQANVELILTGQINEQLSVRLVNRPFNEALDQLLAGTTFGYSRRGNVYRIGDATPGTPTSKAFTQVKVFRLSNSKAKDLFEQLPPAFAALSQGIKIDEPRNALIVTGPPSFVNQVGGFIKELDTNIPIVSFGVKIVELTNTGSQDYNAATAFTNATGATTGPTSIPDSTLYSQDRQNLFGIFAGDPGTVLGLNQITRVLNVLSTLVKTGNARVVTDTKVTAVSGQTTAIDVSEQRNIPLVTNIQNTIGTTANTTIQTISVPTTVTIIPTVQADGNVFADIQIQATSITGFTPIGNSQVPNLATRRVASKVLLRDGETLEIGGLIRNTQSETRNRYPIIGYLPLIGDLFSTLDRVNDRSELLVLVTAYINRRPGKPPLQETPPPGPRLDIIPDGLKLFPKLENP